MTVELEVPVYVGDELESQEAGPEEKPEEKAETRELKDGEIALVGVHRDDDDEHENADEDQPTGKGELISDGVDEWDTARELLEREISDLVIERGNLAERSKSIKKRIDCLAEELSGLRINGPKPIYRTPPKEDDSQDDGQVTQAQAEQQSNPDAWRAAPLADLALKKNVHEKLIESGVETIGQLEDLRAAISMNKKEWPKGIGKAKITEIEDAVITWLTKNRDSEVFQSAGSNEGGEVIDASFTVIPTATQWDAMTDAQRSVYITERAVAINSGKEDCLAKPAGESGDNWDSGREAFQRGTEITDCPYLPGECQDNWIRGYLNADLANVESIEGSAEEPVSEPVSKPVAELSLADL